MTNLTWSDIKVILPLAEKEHVSKKARSPNQIVDQFRQYKTVDNLPAFWQDKREGFIRRHMAQYTKKPSYRRFLALMIWGYLPDELPPKLK